MAYVKLLSLKAREAMAEAFGVELSEPAPEPSYQVVMAKHPAVIAGFQGMRVPQEWPPIPMGESPDRRAPPKGGRIHYADDFPLKSHDGRGYSKRVSLCEAQNWRCAYCGIVVRLWCASSGQQEHDVATIDHVIPKAAKGAVIWSNEVIACSLCNNGRGCMIALNYFAYVQAHGRMKAYHWGRARQRDAQRTRKRPNGY